MATILNYLQQHGPSRSSDIVTWLTHDQKISAEAARKRISQLQEPLFKFPVHLLPKGESFLYHVDHRKTERFWVQFLDAMRTSRSAFGSTIDAILHVVA